MKHLTQRAHRVGSEEVKRGGKGDDEADAGGKQGFTGQHEAQTIEVPLNGS